MLSSDLSEIEPKLLKCSICLTKDQRTLLKTYQNYMDSKLAELDSVISPLHNNNKCKCKLVYHGDCLDNWFISVKNNKCPTCKIVTVTATNTNSNSSNQNLNQSSYPNNCIIDLMVNALMIYINDILHKLISTSNNMQNLFLYYLYGFLLITSFVLLIIVTNFCVIIPYFSFTFIRYVIITSIRTIITEYMKYMEQTEYNEIMNEVSEMFVNIRNGYGY